MTDKTLAELRAERRELDREIAEAEGNEPKPLTLAEIRRLTPEEAGREWQRVVPTLSTVSDSDDAITRSSARARMEAGYAESEQRRRNGGGDE